MSDNTYVIFSSNGQEYTIDEKTTNHDTSLSLIGHGLPDYGEEQNTNFLHLLENFASDEEPINPIIGQLWYKLSDNHGQLKIYTGVGENKWNNVVILSNDDSENHITGDMRYDENEHALFIYDETLEDSKWNRIGPQANKDKIEILLNSVKGENNNYIVEIPNSLFENDIDLNNSGSTGNLNMVKITAMAKEYGVLTPRCCGWLYTFMVNSVKKNGGMYDVSIIGTPNYELIGKTSDYTDWNINVYEKDNSIKIELKNVYITNMNSGINFSCHCSIIRI